MKTSCQFQVKCEFCGKSYKTLINLNKHIILCQVINRNAKTNANANANANTIEDMYKIIESLTIKYNKLKEKN